MTNPSKILFILGASAFMTFSTAVGRAEGVKPPPNGELYSVETSGVGGLTADGGAITTVDESGGAKKIKVQVPTLTGYPGLNFHVPSGGWDLSDFTGVQTDVTNTGEDIVTVDLKVENEGDWHTSPWSDNMVKVAPGSTQTLKVIFGECFGNSAFKLDAGRITSVRIYIQPTKTAASFTLSNPMAFKDANAAPAADAAPAAAAAPEPPPAPAPPPKPKVPLFPASSPVDITGKHDFVSTAPIQDDASGLKGLCSLADFRALPEADRHVYSFDTMPDDKDTFESEFFPFNFHLGTDGVTSQKVTFLPDGGSGPEMKKHVFTRTTDPSSRQSTLTNFGTLDWGATSSQNFRFNKPVMAFGVVERSSGDIDLRKFFWASAALNGYPFSYTLADGTVVNLGEREVSGAHLKAGDNFIGVIDHSGRGIISVSFTLKGLAGNKSQSIELAGLGFVTVPTPAVAPVINLKSSCDFENPDAIVATPAPALDGLASLDDFRFIVANHRYVYRFNTWPQATPDLGSNTGSFSFDLKGKGATDEKVTVTATNAGNTAKLTQTALKSEDGETYHVLGGLGDIGKGAWAEQTFKFQKPVWAFGVTYGSPSDVNLSKSGATPGYPVSYTLSDGKVINLGASGDSGGVIAGKGKTFVGVIDKTDKGISSVTLRVQGTAAGAQPVYIEDMAFALAGPPPGNWKLTMDDEFDGDKLDPAHWQTGYLFADVINNEMQAFVPENVVVADGVCAIKVEKHDGVNTDRDGKQKGPTQKFTSGNFTSYDKFTQTYGYFEARIKMPHYRGAGVWPAFWMLPDRGPNFPKDRGAYKTKTAGMGSEIDIFEFMPRWRQLDGLFPIHCGTIWSYGPVTAEDPDPHGYGSFALGNDGWGPEEMAFPKLDSEFHTYGLYWSPQRLIWYVDSKPIFRVKDTKGNIPDVPEYFMFNISISGNGWGKNPGGSQPTYPEIVADMPNEMQIDYFRAYSGTLEDPLPTPPEDLPVIKSYAQPGDAPASTDPAAPDVTPTPTPTPADATPPAPINSTITTPANG